MERCLLLAVLLSLLPACAGEQVMLPHVGKNPIVFESNAGARAFGAAVQARYDDGGARLRAGVKLGQDAYFNRQIELADTNGDGILSDDEVQSYRRAP